MQEAIAAFRLAHFLACVGECSARGCNIRLGVWRESTFQVCFACVVSKPSYQFAMIPTPDAGAVGDAERERPMCMRPLLPLCAGNFRG
jgi:hypothetical protein